MAGVFTRDTIIADGCQLGGNKNLGLTSAGVVTGSLADDFLNALLDAIARGADWANLRKTTTVQADASDFSKIPSTALPSDYRAILKLHAPKGADFLKHWSWEDLLLLRQNDAANGTAPSGSIPLAYSIDEGGGGAATGGPGDIYVYPKPDTRYTYDLIYFSVPAKLTTNVAPWFPHHMALIYAVADWVKDFQRDSTEAMAQMAAAKLIAQFRTNHRDEGRGDAAVIKFDDTYFPDYTFD